MTGATAVRQATPAPLAPPSRGRAPVARLTWLLGRPSAQSAAAIVLPAVAFAVTTALLLVVLGGTLMFWRWTDPLADLYQLLSVVALALMAMPLLALGGAAARLSARRRDDRLATLRLLGATPAVVTAMTIIESTAVALAGALAGVVLYLALMPLVGLVPFGGAPIGAAALWVGPIALAAVVLAVALLAAASAAVGLRAVNVSPLGVRTRQDPPRLRAVRVVAAVTVVAAAYVILQALGAMPGMVFMAVALGGTFAATIAVLNAAGPWAVGVLARMQVRSARTPAKLIAARGILESPKAAWRQVSGMAMTSFVAVVGGSGMALASSVDPATGAEAHLTADISTGILITLVVSFLMVACSVGVNQAAAILDRRELYVGLDRIGMPRRVMERARTRTTMAPLLFVVIASSAAAGVLLLPLTGMALIVAPLSLAVVAGCFAVGIALVWLALLATRPVLTRVLHAA
ncbi:FtsX-like permease family protein [Microbacterium sp. Marseille-Q6965]|uniref:FtsX-like permease family protein n=1 Tax=Microbacterium sp. Marseille-Q6965 TaxID=2965072 RepID=UPI0021B77430|nr:permease [Microbacterium sp. Marseille-Q6965]